MVKIKLYSNARFTTLVNVYDDLYKLEIQSDISGGSHWEIDIRSTISWVEQYMGIVVVDDISFWIEKELFRGYISELLIDEDFIHISVKDMKSLLSKKLVINDGNLDNNNVANIMSNVLQDWNTWTWEQYIFNTDYVFVTSYGWTSGTTLYDMLDDLATITGCVWTCDMYTITFSKNLWTQTGVQFYLNGLDRQSSNISKIEVKSYNTYSNAVLTSNWVNIYFARDAQEIQQRTAIWYYKTFDTLDIINVSDNELSRRKFIQKEYRIEVDSYQVPELKLFDLANISVVNINSYLDYTGSVSVISKNISLQNRSILVSYWISSEVVYSDSLTRRLRKLEKYSK